MNAQIPNSFQTTGFTQGMSYEDRLRLIGRHLDIRGYHNVVLIELTDGFVVRATQGSDPTPQVLEFLTGQFPDLEQEAIAARGEGERRHPPSPLLPTGYEDFLRSLGWDFDRVQATNVVVSELLSVFAVSGLERQERATQTTYAAFERYLNPESVQALLDDAFSHRTR